MWRVRMWRVVIKNCKSECEGLLLKITISYANVIKVEIVIYCYEFDHVKNFLFISTMIHDCASSTIV